MVDVVLRIGRFTNSSIYKLVAFGSRKMTDEELKIHKEIEPKSRKTTIEDGFSSAGITYIKKKKAERYLGRSTDLGKDSQATVWGKIAEYYCNLFHLGLGYRLISNETIVHPEYNFWSGSPDAETKDTTCEIKCYEPEKFFLLSYFLILLNDKKITLEEFKKQFDDIYWQVVGNSILKGTKYAEIIAYCPTEEQLEKIKSDIEETNILEGLGIDPWKGRFIVEGEKYNLPYVRNSEYPNFVKYRFEVPKEDIEFLTSRVVLAEKYLNDDKLLFGF